MLKIKLMVIALILNAYVVFGVYNRDRTQLNSIELFITFIAATTLIVMSIHMLRKMYFSKTINNKAKLLFSSLFAITMLNLIISSFAEIAYRNGVVYDNNLTMPSISDSYYFSIVTFTTLGYGDFSPNKDVRLLFAGEALIGYIFFASMIGMMIALILKDGD